MLSRFASRGFMSFDYENSKDLVKACGSLALLSCEIVCFMYFIACCQDVLVKFLPVIS